MDKGAVPEIILQDIKKLIAELGQNNITIERAILFGSQASGTATTWSDIDVALISADFTGSRFDDNCRIRKVKLRVNPNFHTQPFTREEFLDSPFAQDEILKHGIDVK